VSVRTYLTLTAPEVLRIDTLNRQALANQS
jgi:hypothetical protein